MVIRFAVSILEYVELSSELNISRICQVFEDALQRMYALAVALAPPVPPETPPVVAPLHTPKYPAPVVVIGAAVLIVKISAS